MTYHDAARRINKHRAIRLGNPVEELPNDWWQILIDLYGDSCMVSGCTNTDLTLDHVVPISKGGAEAMSNFQLLCRKCNGRKGTNLTDYRPI